ncbi:NAD(P)-binding Rossmann-fold containing protein [Madurella fahalii]|uniref:NAD(P)-binding Rossmann-fold containing protein n=1 Tax=Madurella fahalii TaxID=1157608 RepID=A0ABQ0GQH0_9PEZI
MKSFSVATLALVAPGVHAGLRFGCSSLTIQRVDPIVEPGKAPSAHVHHIVGGNAFNHTMEGDIGASPKATCTTCEMSEDFSNYWTAAMYFKHPKNGSYHLVPVVNNAALAPGTRGGMTVYYTQFDFFRDNLEQQPIKAFPPGFRMTVGSPANTNPNEKGNIGLRYNCLTTLINRGPEMADFPTRACPAGIFAVHHFPACWDGKNLDSPDHQSHMFNTMNRDGFSNAPPCPASHPVRMPQVTYETVWDTTKFNGMWTPGVDKQPFVWSFEGNGYGTHADYLFGWKGDSLQRAMDKAECFYDGCGSITKQQMSVANRCKVEDFVGEQVDGWLDALPGQMKK